MEFTAKAQFTRVSPQKARLVLDLIKGKRVEDALSTLQFTKKRIAPKIFQLVRSAVENANYLSQEKGIDVAHATTLVTNALLEEKGAQGNEALATVVGEEEAAAQEKAPAKKKAAGAKKKQAARKAVAKK